MIDCGESDKIIEICGKLDKSNAYKRTINAYKGTIICSFISFLISKDFMKYFPKIKI